MAGRSICVTWTIPSLSLLALVRLVVESGAPTRGPARAEDEMNGERDTDDRLWHPWLRINPDHKVRLCVSP